MQKWQEFIGVIINGMQMLIYIQMNVNKYFEYRSTFDHQMYEISVMILIHMISLCFHSSDP